MPWWVLVLVAVALTAVQFLLMPKPKASKPEQVKDLEDPTSEAGRPVPVPFGTITIKRTYKVKA
jgi:hypothetical protein